MAKTGSRSGPLTIAVDGRCLNRPHVRGIGRYLLRVLQSEAARGIHWVVFGDRLDLPIWIKDSEGVSVRVFECRGDRFQAWEQVALPMKARLASADVMFCPAGTAPMWQPLPTVITLHDVIPWLREDEGIPAGWYRDRVLPSAFRRAAAIMSPSQHSVRDIAARWPALESKNVMVPNGVDETLLYARPGPLPERLVATGVRAPYVLYVGGEIPRKRLDWALDIWRDATQGAVQFVACGVNPAAQEGVRHSLEPALRPRVHFLDYLSDDEMAAMYANATTVLYPTIYEGFGLPALEAQACGAPVVFSAVGSLTELAGPGAIVLPVGDREAWVAVCRQHVQQGIHGVIPNESGRAWAAQFTWASTATRVVSILHAAARNMPDPALRECAP